MGRPIDLCDLLTERQRDVLEMVARGKTNFEIAESLGITLDGAKYHLREIMARLGCDTREEAVSIWLARPSRVRRAILRSTAFFSPSWSNLPVAGTVTASVLVLGFVVVLAGLRTGSGADAVDGMPSQAESPGQQASASLSFLDCGTTVFRRPSIAEMAHSFGVTRFGESGTDHASHVSPANFAYFLSNVYQVAPDAVSPTLESSMLSGSQLNASAPVVSAADPRCAAVRGDRAARFYEFWLVDAVPRRIELAGETLTIVAAEAAGAASSLIFPDPPASSSSGADPLAGLPHFTEVRLVGADGELLYSRGAQGTARYRPDRTLLMATGAAAGFTFEVAGEAQSLVAYARASAVIGVVVKDANGVTWPSAPTASAPDTWTEVFRGQLPPGRYTISGAELVVPPGTELP